MIQLFHVLSSTSPDPSGSGNVIPNRMLQVLDQIPEEYWLYERDRDCQFRNPTPRRIPLSMRTVVEEKIEELLRDDIIENAYGPTSWLSPVHVVKQSDSVRMVVDMSVANSAVLRSGRTLRTPEEIFCELGGAKHFT